MSPISFIFVVFRYFLEISKGIGKDCKLRERLRLQRSCGYGSCFLRQARRDSKWSRYSRCDNKNNRNRISYNVCIREYSPKEIAHEEEHVTSTNFNANIKRERTKQKINKRIKVTTCNIINIIYNRI